MFTKLYTPPQCGIPDNIGLSF